MRRGESPGGAFENFAGSSESMAKDRLPVAVVGVGGVGDMTLRAIMQSDVVDLVGVSDLDGRLAEATGKELDVPAYGDNRSLLAEARPRAVYLAVPPNAAPEIISACAERGIHIWKESPLARNLAEGVAMVQGAEQARVKLAVGTQRRFCEGYRRAAGLMDRLGEVFLARAHYLFNWGANLDWRGDKASAGGGALLDLGYHPIDLLVRLLGFPEEVYGALSGTRGGDVAADGDQPERVYDTEDTATAILRYHGGLMATVVASRRSGPVSEGLSLHGRGGSLSADGENCLLRDPDGNVLYTIADQSPPLSAFRLQAESFAAAVLTDSPHYECSGRENLLNMAVIEAIYLSEQTCQPESPLRLLKTHGLAVADCLTNRESAQGEKAGAR